MLDEKTSDEIDAFTDRIPGSHFFLNPGPLKNDSHAKILDMSDLWRTFRDGRYYNLPAT